MRTISCTTSVGSAASLTAARRRARGDALYLGLTLAYGGRLITGADVRFAHSFADGPPPRALHGWAYTRRCWADVLRTTAAAGVAAGLLFGMQHWIGDPDRTSALDQFFPLPGVVCVRGGAAVGPRVHGMAQDIS